MPPFDAEDRAAAGRMGIWLGAAVVPLVVLLTCLTPQAGTTSLSSSSSRSSESVTATRTTSRGGSMTHSSRSVSSSSPTKRTWTESLLSHSSQSRASSSPTAEVSTSVEGLVTASTSRTSSATSSVSASSTNAGTVTASASSLSVTASASSFSVTASASPLSITPVVPPKRTDTSTRSHIISVTTAAPLTPSESELRTATKSWTRPTRSATTMTAPARTESESTRAPVTSSAMGTASAVSNTLSRELSLTATANTTASQAMSRTQSETATETRRSPTTTASDSKLLSRYSHSQGRSATDTGNASETASRSEAARLPCPLGVAGAAAVFATLPGNGDMTPDSSSPGVLDAPRVAEDTVRGGFALNITCSSGVLFSVGANGAEALMHTGLAAVRLCDNRPVLLGVIIVSTEAQMLGLVLRSPDFYVPSSAPFCSLLVELPPYLFHCDAPSGSQRAFVLEVTSSAPAVESAAPATLLSFFVLGVAVGHALPEAQLFSLSTFSTCLATSAPGSLTLHQRLVSPFADGSGPVNGLASSVIAIVVVWAVSCAAVAAFKLALHVPWSRAQHWLFFPGLPLYATSVLLPSIALNSLRVWLQLQWQLSQSAVSRSTAVFLVVLGLLITVGLGGIVCGVSWVVAAAAGAPSDGRGMHFVEGRVFQEVRRRIALRASTPRDILVRLVAPQVSWMPASAVTSLGPLFTNLLPADAMFALASWGQVVCLSLLYAIPAARGTSECAAVHAVALVVIASMLAMSAWLLPYASLALSFTHVASQAFLLANSIFNLAYGEDGTYRVAVGLNPGTIGFCSIFTIATIAAVSLRVAMWLLRERTGRWGVEDGDGGDGGDEGGGTVGVRLPIFLGVALEEELLKP